MNATAKIATFNAANIDAMKNQYRALNEVLEGYNVDEFLFEKQIAAAITHLMNLRDCCFNAGYRIVQIFGGEVLVYKWEELEETGRAAARKFFEENPTAIDAEAFTFASRFTRETYPSLMQRADFNRGFREVVKARR